MIRIRDKEEGKAKDVYPPRAEGGGDVSEGEGV